MIHTGLGIRRADAKSITEAKKIVIRKVVGEVREEDKISFISLIFFKALKLSLISFFLDLLSLKDIDLKVDVSLKIDVFLKLLSLNRENIKITCSPLFRVLKYRFLGYLLDLLVDFSIDFFANYFANYLISILFLFTRRDFLNLRVILIIYYRKE